MRQAAASVFLALFVSACATSLHNPTIAQLQQNPARYHDHTVSVSGVVTSAWGLPLVPVKLYKVDDGTGEVTVVSQHGFAPARGSRVRVRGRVSDLAIVGGRSVGLHMTEESLHVK